jgi:hypothetical protein
MRGGRGSGRAGGSDVACQQELSGLLHPRDLVWFVRVVIGLQDSEPILDLAPSKITEAGDIKPTEEHVVDEISRREVTVNTSEVSVIRTVVCLGEYSAARPLQSETLQIVDLV